MSMGRPLAINVRIDSISASSTGIGSRPLRTIPRTAAEVITRNLSRTPKRQNRYPGKQHHVERLGPVRPSPPRPVQRQIHFKPLRPQTASGKVFMFRVDCKRVPGLHVGF